HCEQCQELAAELRKMSQEMMAWEVEELEPAEQMPIAIRAALQDGPRKSKKVLKPRGWRVVLTPRALAWSGGALGLALFFLVFGFSRLRPTRHAFIEPQQGEAIATYITPVPTATPASSDSFSVYPKVAVPEKRAGKAQVSKTEDSVEGSEATDGQGVGG